MLNEKQVNDVIQYIQSDNFNPAIFKTSYPVSIFEEKDIARVGEALYKKGVHYHQLSISNALTIVGLNVTAKREIHWYNINAKRNLKKVNEGSSNIIHNQANSSADTLDLAMMFGNDNARLYKVNNKIIHTENVSTTATKKFG